MGLCSWAGKTGIWYRLLLGNDNRVSHGNKHLILFKGSWYWDSYMFVIEGWYIHMLQNQPMDSLKWFCVLLPSIPMADICDDFVFPFHWGYHLCSFIHILSHVFFFLIHILFFVEVVYTCDAGVLKVIILRMCFVLWLIMHLVLALVYSILKNGPLHSFLSFRNSETKNKFLTFFGEKIGWGNSKSLTW